jgi:ActR/RegA family two-component response regulator
MNEANRMAVRSIGCSVSRRLSNMAPTLQGNRVLILEDEYFLADDLARALRERGAEPVGPVSSVTEAEQLLARERLDAAIVDLNLRGEMATEFVSRLAATRLPCLIVSGYGSEAVPESIAHVPRIEKPTSAAAVLQTLSARIEPAG